MTKIMSEAEATEVIKNGKIGRLGCVDGGEPYVVPINYLLDDDGSICSHSLPGRKIDAMRAHPRACLQVDHIDDDFHWSSAIAFGNFEEMDRPGERRAILGKILGRFPKLTPVESRIVQDAAAPDSIVFRIVVDRITGVEEE
jgi:nitroimidazol reductase NimA-like FMN-containing flavoprotein (pyridoxamine 5'-phosphate oxidase superfamily)